MSLRRTASALAALGAACSVEAIQPVAYNHDLHVGRLQIDCEACHQGSWSGVVAGLPDLSVCDDCHKQMRGTSAEERKVVDAIRAGRAISWVRLYELPRDVFFTHRRHVDGAEIECERCHGQMGKQVRPPPTALVALSMNDCISCHEERKAGTDCSHCHR